MKKLMLIGGGDIGRGNTIYETKNIDIEIVKMAEKENPNLLFIGLASSFSDSYYDTIKKIYKELNCNCTYLKKKNIIHNPNIVEDKIKSADIIYIGGGDTIKLINEIVEYKIDKLLLEAYHNGVVLAGISAGAILLSYEGFSDSLILRGEGNKNIFLKGLNFANLSICPHYNSDTKKKEELFESLMNEQRKVYGLENCTALKIVDEKVSVIQSNPNNHVYLCYQDNKIVEEKLI